MYSYFKNCCCLNIKGCIVIACMHVENELVEFVTEDEQEYEEVIKEYKEEVLV